MQPDAPIRRCLKGWGDVLAALPKDMASEVRDGYCLPARHYHDGEHVGGIWSTWLMLGGSADDEAMLWATAYHDIVYVIGQAKGFNEEQSARRLLEVIGRKIENGERPNLASLSEAVLMIKATEDHLRATHDRAILFCDLDLAGLACPLDEFRDNTRRVRLECSAMHPVMFNKGRVAFWKSLLSEPRIYRSGFVPAWWEDQARSNIEQDIRDVELEALA